MISVLVQRLPGDKQGPDISDPLITTVQVAQERGRREIDYNCSNRQLISSTGPLAGYMRPGKLVEVADAEKITWRGMIRTCAISINRDGDSFTADVNLRIERVHNDD